MERNTSSDLTKSHVQTNALIVTEFWFINSVESDVPSCPQCPLW